MKKVKLIGSTWLCLAAALFLAVLFVVRATSPALNNRLPSDTELTARDDGALLCDGVGDDVVVFRGESLRILGICGPKSPHPGFFWAETARGFRGCVPQSLFGSRAVLTESSKRIGYEKGDSVTILITNVKGGKAFYGVESDRGDFFEVEAEMAPTLEALAFAKNHKTLAESPRRLMNTRQFERRYLLCSFKQNHDRHIPSAVVAPEGEGMASLENICLLSQNGRWYQVELHYDADGITRNYTVREGFTRNTALCRAFYPLIQSMLSVAPLAQQWGESVYRPLRSRPQGGAGFFRAVGKGVWWLLCTLPWLFLTPFFLPLLIYGLLRFPRLFRHLGNRTVRLVMAVLAVAGVLLWFVVLLPGLPAWLYTIEAVLLWFFFKLLGKGVLASSIPHFRCPQCRSLGTHRPAEHKLVKEHDVWEASTDRIGREILNFRQYGTSTKHSKTTTFEDGKREENTWETDKKMHTEEQGVDTYADYNVRYHVCEYEDLYRCSVCGHEEKRAAVEKSEAERKQQGAYTKSYTTHTVEKQ